MSFFLVLVSGEGGNCGFGLFGGSNIDKGIFSPIIPPPPEPRPGGLNVRAIKFLIALCSSAGPHPPVHNNDGASPALGSVACAVFLQNSFNNALIPLPQPLLLPVRVLPFSLDWV